MTFFDYDEFVGRNIGFVTQQQQDMLRGGKVFIAGVGGMGGAAFVSLVRAGVGEIGIADIDSFELSNLNRQVAATLDTVGMDKTEASAALARNINPNIELEVLGGEWLEHLPRITAAYPVVINGTDDVRASIALYRAAKDAGATVIDAYAASLPSVYVVRSDDLRPEQRMGYSTAGIEIDEITDDMVDACVLRELEYVLANSSSRHYVDLDIAAEFAAGKRKRFSYAPMVITTGNLMAYEALALLTGQHTRTDHRGYFFNPYTGRVERPSLAPIKAVKTWLVRRFLNRLIAE